MKNRELKFRVWDIKNNRFLSDWHEFIALWGTNLKDKDIFEVCGPNNKETNYIIQQHTGITTNNVDIYEGDLIDYNESEIDGERGIGEVFYNPDVLVGGPSFCMWVMEKNGIKGGFGISPFPAFGPCKVIGNIFEGIKNERL